MMMYVFTRIDLQDLISQAVTCRACTHRCRQDLGVYQVLSGKGIKTVLFSLGARGLDHWGPNRCINHDIPSGKLTVCYGIDGPVIVDLPIRSDDFP